MNKTHRNYGDTHRPDISETDIRTTDVFAGFALTVRLMAELIRARLSLLLFYNSSQRYIKIRHNEWDCFV